MKTLCKKVTNGIRTFDLFPCTQFLRYKGESDYKTTTGGCLSIALMVIFIVLFYNMGFQTMRKELIYSSLNIKKQNDPQPASMNFVQSEGFMLGLGLHFLPLTDPNVTYFDIEMVHTQIGALFSSTTQTIPLVPCTQQHFDFSEETKQSFYDNYGSAWLCPPIGQNITVDGKLLSPNYEYFQIRVKRCNTSLHSNCVNETQALARVGGQFRMGVMYVDNTINSDDKIYHESSFETRNQFIFTPTSAIEAQGYIEKVVVNTDESLWPIQDIVTQKFLAINEMFISRPMSVVNDIYLNIKFQKSPIQRTFNRSFNKLDTFLSYVGGIIGILLAIIALLVSYSDKAFAISVASQLFVSDNDEPISSTGFHICYMPMILLRNFLNWIGACKQGWKQTDFYNRCLTQTEEQLDVISIMKKLVFMEKAFSLLFTSHQLQALHLFQRQRIDEAEQRRKKYDLQTKLNKTVMGQMQKMSNPSSAADNNDLECQGNKVVPMEGEIVSGQLSAASLSKMEIGSQKRLKTQLIKLMQDSNRGDNISNRILTGLSPEILGKMGLNDEEIDQVVSGGEYKRASFMEPTEELRMQSSMLSQLRKKSSNLGKVRLGHEGEIQSVGSSDT